MTIEMARPQISDLEIELINKVLRSGRWAAGQNVKEFEETFAAFVGTEFAIATSSGTTALQAILRALPLNPGDRVITTPLSFIATSNAILDTGAIPVFVDISPETFNLDPGAVKRAIKQYPGVKAIVGVHLYGLPFSQELVDIAKDYNIYLIEDAAQAHGASLNGKKTGSIGHAAAFSFYPTKNMTTTEGGMVTTSDSALAERVRYITNQGQRARYDYACLGFNYRMTELQAVLGLSQLTQLGDLNLRRREIAAQYSRDIPTELKPPIEVPGAKHVFHQYTLRSPNRMRLMQALKQHGIASAIYYPRLIPRETFMQSFYFELQPIPAAEQAAAEVFSIPVHPALTDDDVTFVTAVLRNEWEAIINGN